MENIRPRERREEGDYHFKQGLKTAGKVYNVVYVFRHMIHNNSYSRPFTAANNKNI